jgi:hypothetical protein
LGPGIGILLSHCKITMHIPSFYRREHWLYPMMKENFQWNSWKINYGTEYYPTKTETS